MQRVRSGDIVRIHFTGRLLDGRVFGSSAGRQALELQVGNSTVLRGLHQALVGMCPGEAKTTIIPADEAFGRRQSELVLRIDARALPREARPRVGETLQLQSGSGDRLVAQVIAVTADEVTLDANHPLAGQDLAFEIEVLGIGPAAPAN